MKIVIATPLYPPEIGGPATYAKLLFEGLPEKGIAVELVKFSEVRHLPKFIRHYVYYRRVLLAARGADVVYALDPVSVGFPAMRAARKLGKPFIVKIVGDYAWEQGSQRFGVTQSLDAFIKTKPESFVVRILQRIQSRVARNATRIIVPSDYLKGVVATWKDVKKENIEIIYNAVSLGSVGNVPIDIANLPRPLIVTAGRLVSWKNMDGVIDAVARIQGASLAIVGDGSERAALERRAQENLPGRVVFTGTLLHEDTLAVLKSADVFALNSSYEGLSHLLVEAQALGVPIVATNVGGNPEVITDEKDGLLVPVGDPSALLHALERIISDEALRVYLSVRAVESAKRFTVDAMLARIADTLFKSARTTS
ncbi:MAG: glycosyltransferase family 4 protein [Minisyncoccia bacterium]